MSKNRWMACGLAVSLLAPAGAALAQDEAVLAPKEPETSAPVQVEQTAPYEKPPRPEKPPIQIVESGPFKMKDKRGYRNMVILGPRLLPPGIGGRYIRSIDDHISVMVGGGWSGWSLPGFAMRHTDARAGIDYQPVGNGMHGFYIGPRVIYRSFFGSIGEESPDNGLSVKTLGAGGVMGWRAIWNPGISMGAGIGATYNTFVADAGELDNENTLSITGLAPQLEFTLGFAF